MTLDDAHCALLSANLDGTGWTNYSQVTLPPYVTFTVDEANGNYYGLQLRVAKRALVAWTDPSREGAAIDFASSPAVDVPRLTALMTLADFTWTPLPIPEFDWQVSAKAAVLNG